MTTLHIMLASGENLPNLIPAITGLKNDANFKADTALILTSKKMRERAQTLKTALETAGVKKVRIYAENCPDHDLAEIRAWARAQADEIGGNYHDSRRILNITGGNKLMTLAFSEAFQNGKTEIIYCDTEHYRIEYIHDELALDLPVNTLKLSVYLAAQGFKLRRDETDIEGIRARAGLTRALAEAAPRIEALLRALNAAFFEYEKNVSGTVWADKLKTPEEKKLLEEIRRLKLLEGSKLKTSAAARYLGGGWLEEWCWIVGEELEQEPPGKRLQRDRWGISQKIDAIGDSGKTQYPLNELDAVFVHRNRMLLIECKTGVQLSEHGKSQEILNKLEALGKHVSGRLDTKWLLTARDIHANSQTWERAGRYGIRIVKPSELKDLKNMVQQWMTSR
jgi:hypothetical protein